MKFIIRALIGVSAVVFSPCATAQDAAPLADPGSGEARVIMKPEKPLEGVLVPPGPNLPPPVLVLPNDPVPSPRVRPAAPKAVPAASRTITDAYYGAWKNQKGNADFKPSMTYVDGMPSILLTTTKNETPEVVASRQKAIVALCEGMLGDAAFERVLVSVIHIERENRRATVIKNYFVDRAAFQAAAKVTGRSSNLSAALQATKADPTATAALCSTLGIK